MATKRRKTLLAAAERAKVDSEEIENQEKTKPRNRSLDVLEQRQNLLSEITAGRREEVLHKQIDPSRCKMWRRHNRLYDRLTAENCDDLISKIGDVGQKIPAIARRLNNDPDGFEYEIICGARRHFAVSYLRNNLGRDDLFYKIEIHHLSDEDAFKLSDLENRSRKDISDYERGLDYQSGLDEFYNGNIGKMAEKIGIKRQSLSNYLYLAQLPEEIVRAYGDPLQIAVRHGVVLTPMIKKPASREQVLAKANEIAHEQEKAMELGKAIAFDGASVFKVLSAAGQGAKKKPSKSNQ